MLSLEREHLKHEKRQVDFVQVQCIQSVVPPRPPSIEQFNQAFHHLLLTDFVKEVICPLTLLHQPSCLVSDVSIRLESVGRNPTGAESSPNTEMSTMDWNSLCCCLTKFLWEYVPTLKDIDHIVTLSLHYRGPLPEQKLRNSLTFIMERIMDRPTIYPPPSVSSFSQWQQRERSHAAWFALSASGKKRDETYNVKG